MEALVGRRNELLEKKWGLIRTRQKIERENKNPLEPNKKAEDIRGQGKVLQEKIDEVKLQIIALREQEANAMLTVEEPSVMETIMDAVEDLVTGAEDPSVPVFS